MSELEAQNRRKPNAQQMSPLLRIALLLGVLAHLLGFFVFRVSSNPLHSRAEDAAFVVLVSTDLDRDSEALIEQASLFDSAPLFIPGEWSAASAVFSGQIMQDWRNFPDFEPDISLLRDVRPDRLSLPRVADVKQPADLLDLRFWDIFSHFGEGEGELAIEAFESWSPVAVVTIISGNDAYPVDYEMRLEVDLPAEEFAERPAVFYVNMSAQGLLMGAPLLQQSSGSDALDVAVSEWLTRPATLANLPAGYLELRVFP